MKRVYHIATYSFICVYTYIYSVRNNFIIIEWLSVSPRNYLMALLVWDVFWVLLSLANQI